MGINLLQLKNYFRDEEQEKAVRDIIRSRLADDRNQEECRYIMRFWWQLIMTYQEVTLNQLRTFVSPEKLAIIFNLLDSLELGADAVDIWVDKYTKELPVIEDNGFKQYSK